MGVEGKALLEGMKLLPKLPFPIALVTGVLLFGPEALTTSLGLGGFLELFRPWIGVVFLLSVGVGLQLVVLWLWGELGLGRTIIERVAVYRYRRRLSELTSGEKAVLARYVVSGTTSQRFPLDDGVVGGLVAQKVLFISTKQGDTWQGFAHNLQPWAKTYLWKHRELLEPELSRLEEEIERGRKGSM